VLSCTVINRSTDAYQLSESFVFDDYSEGLIDIEITTLTLISCVFAVNRPMQC